MDFKNKEELAKELISALEEGRLILLHVPLGTKIWRVHRAFIPKEKGACGVYYDWESIWTYDKEEYSLTHYNNNKDIFYSEEEAHREVMERMKKNN